MRKKVQSGKEIARAMLKSLNEATRTESDGPEQTRNDGKPADVLESPEYVRQWAKDLVAAAGKKDARKLLADYKAIASNRRLEKADRDVAAQRAEALERLV